MIHAMKLLCRCRELSIDLASGPDGTLRWEADTAPSPDLLSELRAAKGELLRLIGPSNPSTWSSTVAAEAIALALAAWRWPADPEAARRLGQLADTVDACYLARDLVGLLIAVAEFLRAVETLGNVTSSAAPDFYRECPGCCFCLPRVSGVENAGKADGDSEFDDR
jgi:hypothetical protein